jgi:hypothetical protein
MVILSPRSFMVCKVWMVTLLVFIPPSLRGGAAGAGF